MVGCSAAIAAMAGSRVTNMTFAGPGTAAAGNNEILVVVFLRGGCDGLSLVSPYTDPRYRQARGNLALPESGAYQALSIDPKNSSYSGRSGFGLHPAAQALHELYTGANAPLAIVHACGLNDDTRSHFDAMDYIERGTPGNKNTGSGWISRHLNLVNPTGTLPAVSAGATVPTSLLNDGQAVSVNDLNGFGVSSYWRYTNEPDAASRDPAYIPMLNTMKKLFPGTGSFPEAGQRVISTIETIRSKKAQAPGGELVNPITPGLKYPYPNNAFGEALKTVAHTVKLDLGMQVATVDLGGWDTHEGQGNEGQGYFATLVKTLSEGLYAFYNDLAAYHSRLTVVVLSEFGRRLGANTGGGTDHGHGGVTLLLGGNVSGGKLYGNWPGLEQLDQEQDLKITTDFRSVLGEIVVKRLGNPFLGRVFPGLDETTYQPLGIMRGGSSPLEPDFSTTGGLFLPLMTR